MPRQDNVVVTFQTEGDVILPYIYSINLDTFNKNTMLYSHASKILREVTDDNLDLSMLIGRSCKIKIAHRINDTGSYEEVVAVQPTGDIKRTPVAFVHAPQVITKERRDASSGVIGGKP